MFKMNENIEYSSFIFLNRILQNKYSAITELEYERKNKNNEWFKLINELIKQNIYVFTNSLTMLTLIILEK